jgi:hypothetical protein
MASAPKASLRVPQRRNSDPLVSLDKLMSNSSDKDFASFVAHVRVSSSGSNTPRSHSTGESPGSRNQTHGAASRPDLSLLMKSRARSCSPAGFGREASAARQATPGHSPLALAVMNSRHKVFGDESASCSPRVASWSSSPWTKVERSLSEVSTSSTATTNDKGGGPRPGLLCALSINTLSSLPDTVRSFGRAGSSSHRLEGAFSETDGNDYPNSCESSAEDIDPCSRAPLASDTVLGCKGAQDRSGVDGADGSEPAGATDSWPRAPSLDIVAAAAAAHLAGGDDSAPRAPPRPTRIRRHSEPLTQGSSDAARSRNRSKE